MPSPGGGGDGSVRSKRSRKRKRFADEEEPEAHSLLTLQPATAGGGPDSIGKAAPALSLAKPAPRTMRSAREGVRKSPPSSSQKASSPPAAAPIGDRAVVASPKKLLPLQKSLNHQQSAASALTSSPSTIVVESSVKKPCKSRQPVSSPDVAAVASDPDDVGATNCATPATSDDVDKSPSRSKAGDSSSSLFVAPVIELGPSNNNGSDRKTILSPERRKREVAAKEDSKLRLSPILTNGDGSKTSEQYPYLRFDFSLPPAELASKLVEGVNVPGSGQPIHMEAPKLPPGWIKKVTVRQAIQSNLI
jgi:hypothetical protein